MNARSNRIYLALTSGARSGAVGELTNGLYWPNGDIAVAPIVGGIVETARGSYTATRTAPEVTETTTFVITWYDPVTDESNVEELVVSAMGFDGTVVYYASPEDVRKYLNITEDQMSDEILYGPIQRAQEDVDAACGGLVVYPDTGLKFATATIDSLLSDIAALMLMKATCAQVEYRLTVGDDFLIRDQHESQSGPGYGTAGKLQKVSGRTYTYLRQGGFLQLHGRFVSGSQSSFNRSGSIPRAN